MFCSNNLENTTYDHSTMIGNEGDVVKHAVLCRLVEAVLDQTPSAPFVYAESHNGRAVYVLPERGRWLNGIKPFSENLLEIEGKNAARATIPVYKSLDAYKRTCFREKAKAGRKYCGSSGMVYKMLTDSNIPFQFRLWDSNPDVVSSLYGSYRDCPDIVVTRGDGYVGLQSLESACLALIDPISVQDDKTSILATMSHFAEREIPFLCWVPLFGEDRPIFNQFEREAKESYATVRVTWQVREGSTWGCQVTVPIPYRSILGETCRDVCEVMNAKPWTMRIS